MLYFVFGEIVIEIGDKFVWFEGLGGIFNFLINKIDFNDKIKI